MSRSSFHHTAHSARRVGFTAHQVAEYAIGAALVAIGLHLSGITELEFGFTGGVLIVLNLMTSARLGAFGILSRNGHHVIDLVIVVLLMVSPALSSVRAHIETIIAGEALALLLGWIEHSTRYAVVTKPLQVIPARVVGGTSSTMASDPRATTVANHYARRIGLLTGATRKVVRERRGRASRPGS